MMLINAKTGIGQCLSDLAFAPTLLPIGKQLMGSIISAK